MKILKRKGFIQKIIITLIILIMFNFIVPRYSSATDKFGWGWDGGSIAGPICEFVCWVGDSIIGILQDIFLPNSKDPVEEKLPLDIKMDELYSKATNANLTQEEMQKALREWRVYDNVKRNGYIDEDAAAAEASLMLGYSISGNLFKNQSVVNIFYGPLTIFSNLIPALDVNFINPELSYSGVNKINYGVGADGIVYVDSIEMNPPNTAQDSGNIAKSLQREVASWYNALRNLAIVFLLSVLIYIAIRIILSSAAGETAKYKSMLKDWLIALCILFFMHYFMAFLLKSTEMIIGFLSNNANGDMYIDSFMSEIRGRIPLESNLNQWAYTVMYFTLVCYTLTFTWRYLKRVVYLAFLTVVSPMVAFTYPIDKIKDGSAQAFNKWFKEYLFNILIQPVHLLLYTVLITSAKDLAHTNILYSLVALGFMLEAEKIVKDFFGLQAQRGESTGAAITGGAMFAATVGLVQKGLGLLPEGDGGKGDKSKPRYNNREKDSKASDRVKKAWLNDSEEGGDRSPNGPVSAPAGSGSPNGPVSAPAGSGLPNGTVSGPDGNIHGNTVFGAEPANVLNNNTSNSYMTSTDTSNPNISGLNTPGNIGQATIQHAIIQSATINQGANTSGQIRSQGQVNQGAQAMMGAIGSGSMSNFNNVINPQSQVIPSSNEAEDSEQNESSNSSNEGFLRRVWRGTKFAASDAVNKDRGKKIAKKALKLGLMGAGAAAFGTMGLGAGLAGNGTDDVVKYTGMGLGLGALAGKKGYNITQQTYHDTRDRAETFKQGYYGKDYWDKSYGPRLDKEYKNDPETRRHYQMYYGQDWKNAMDQGIELRKMGITNQDDIDIALQRVRSGENKNLSLEKVASIMQFYKEYSRRDLEDPKYQRNIYQQALKMAGGNKQKAVEIVNAVMKSRKVRKPFVPPSDDEMEQ